MKNRIEHIIRAKNLTATEFAEKLGVQPSGISHLLSGRNNPSLDFVKRLKETFPEYNLDWIIFGTGPMTSSDYSLPPSADSQTEAAKETVSGDVDMDLFTIPPAVASKAVLPQTSGETEEKTESPVAGNVSRSTAYTVLRSIILVYSDNSFEVLHQK